MKFVYLIGSCIEVSNDYPVKHTAQRSFFDVQQRLDQTQKTIENIKSLDSQAVIYLIDSSVTEFSQFVELAKNDSTFHYVTINKINPELAQVVRTHRSKSHGECLMFLEFLRHHKKDLVNFDYVVKLSGRYIINQQRYTQEIFTDQQRDHFYFIGPYTWNRTDWQHVSKFYPNDFVDSNDQTHSILTSLYVTGVQLLDQLEICLAAATTLTDTINKMHYIDVEYVLYYIFRQLKLLDKLKLLTWQVEGHCGVTGEYRKFSKGPIYKTIKSSQLPEYPVVKFGYMPAYMGNSKYNFTKTFPKKVSVSFDNINTDMTADYRVVVQCEPPHLYRVFPKMILDNIDKFDLVLTYNESLFKLSNHEHFLPIGCFVDELELEKTNQISYIMSSKIMTNEHRMRFMILREVENSNKIGDFDFIMHRNPPEIDSKNSYFVNAKFHITCENAIMPNMFSEKIIDCFRTRTIPLYYGCSNIENYFDQRGIIRFNTIEEFRQICKEITPEWYDQRLPYIEENYQRARPYWEKSVYQRVEDIIERRLKQKFPECY
jgi:hypothetical protein